MQLKQSGNVALDKESQHNIEKFDQIGECPIISYKHIQEWNGLNDKQEFKNGLKDYYKLLPGLLFGRKSWGDHTSGGVL